MIDIDTEETKEQSKRHKAAMDALQKELKKAKVCACVCVPTRVVQVVLGVGDRQGMCGCECGSHLVQVSA